MKSGLYRIEVHANYLEPTTDADKTNLPEPDRCAMITDSQGITFAKLHPVRIVAKTKKDDLMPCPACELMKYQRITIPNPYGGTTTEPVRYCPLCGRRLDGEEAQE